jgi:hypothetical protein
MIYQGPGVNVSNGPVVHQAPGITDTIKVHAEHGEKNEFIYVPTSPTFFDLALCSLV